jgi:hypothetical protein
MMTREGWHESVATEDGEQTWRRHIWSRTIGAAIASHNKQSRVKSRIPANASACSFRHARISELLQIHGIDPLTVAAQTGTSLVMIEKAYLRLIPSALQEKLAALKAQRRQLMPHTAFNPTMPVKACIAFMPLNA